MAGISCRDGAGFAEGLDKTAYGGAAGYAKQTARCKALDVAKSLREKGRRPSLIIGAGHGKSTICQTAVQLPSWTRQYIPAYMKHPTPWELDVLVAASRMDPTSARMGKAMSLAGIGASRALFCTLKWRCQNQWISADRWACYVTARF